MRPTYNKAASALIDEIDAKIINVTYTREKNIHNISRCLKYMCTIKFTNGSPNNYKNISYQFFDRIPVSSKLYNKQFNFSVELEIEYRNGHCYKGKIVCTHVYIFYAN